jgi:hypothetical protein
MVRYDGGGVSGPVELAAEQILTTLNIDGVVIAYPDGSQAVWPPKDSRWRLDE